MPPLLCSGTLSLAEGLGKRHLDQEIARLRETIAEAQQKLEGLLAERQRRYGPATPEDGSPAQWSFGAEIWDFGEFLGKDTAVSASTGDRLVSNESETREQAPSSLQPSSAGREDPSSNDFLANNPA